MEMMQKFQDTLHDLNMPYVRDAIKKLSQRYANRLVEHSRLSSSDAETPRRLKKKLLEDLCI